MLVPLDLHKTGDDEKEPYLTGLDFLPDGKLVAVDNFNNKCIILNERLQRLGTPYKFNYRPQCFILFFPNHACFYLSYISHKLKTTRNRIPRVSRLPVNIL
ncbi:hypothetical protein DPMN_033788 [Dreissena polymorpha]|uniref:Uncharacterized protein n=1 Tax=Dreissena polymorpha TaxID=45954 RepID=A0A9D4RLG9_DREPO|nr:hypothetical protein DPMN_033788 [Dreissena polymorpha]